MSVTQKPSLRLAFIGMKGLPPDLPGAGGGERETDAKARRLAARGHQVTVYCRWSYMRHPPNPYEGVRLVSLPAISRAGLEMLSHTPLATLHAILTNSADIVSYHGMGNALFLPLVKLSGKKSVVYMDGVDWERPKWGRLARLLLKWGAAAAFRWADEVYVDNRVSAGEFAQIFDRAPKMITLAADIWPSPGTELLAPMGLIPDRYVLFVGMLRPDKGVHLLVEAYRGLETDVPLVIVGDNPDDPDYVRTLKAAADGRVRFLGYQYGAAARQLFANCLIYVQPSVMEGNSPALMSAMACGRCVVVNGIAQNLETIGDAGVACTPNDAADLRTKLAALLADPAGARRLGEMAKNRIEQVYNWDAVVDQLEALYWQVFRKNTGAAAGSVGEEVG
jgi:glycosyltransferase involved in cell wall biosynthesis